MISDKEKIKGSVSDSELQMVETTIKDYESWLSTNESTATKEDFDD